MMQQKSHTWRPPESLRIAAPKEGGFLHMGGTTDTFNRDYAWKGTRAQFEQLPIQHGNYTLTRTGQ